MLFVGLAIPMIGPFFLQPQSLKHARDILRIPQFAYHHALTCFTLTPSKLSPPLDIHTDIDMNIDINIDISRSRPEHESQGMNY